MPIIVYAVKTPPEQKTAYQLTSKTIRYRNCAKAIVSILTGIKAKLKGEE